MNAYEMGDIFEKIALTRAHTHNQKGQFWSIFVSSKLHMAINLNGDEFVSFTEQIE